MAHRRSRLVGAHEIRVLLGSVSRQRVYQITIRSDFPAPVAELAQGKVWDADAVTAWIEARPALSAHREPPARHELEPSLGGRARA